MSSRRGVPDEGGPMRLQERGDKLTVTCRTSPDNANVVAERDRFHAEGVYWHAYERYVLAREQLEETEDRWYFGEVDQEYAQARHAAAEHELSAAGVALSQSRRDEIQEQVNLGRDSFENEAVMLSLEYAIQLYRLEDLARYDGFFDKSLAEQRAIVVKAMREEKARLEAQGDSRYANLGLPE